MAQTKDVDFKVIDGFIRNPTKPTMNQWIDVKDELPPIGQIVIIYDYREGIYLASREDGYWSEHCTGCGCCEERLDPTHWQPAPNKPQDKPQETFHE